MLQSRTNGLSGLASMANHKLPSKVSGILDRYPGIQPLKLYVCPSLVLGGLM